MKAHKVKVTVMMLVVLLVCAMTAAMAQGTERFARGPKAPELTPQEKAFLDQAKELRKQIRITRLELALLEAKDAPEGQIAKKAEDLYRLQGRLYALRAKNRALARKLHRHRMRPGWRHSRGRGAGWGLGRAWGGPGMGRHRGHGLGRGMGHGIWRGMGCGRGRGFGPGMGQGLGFREPGMGRGERLGLGMGLEEQGMDLGMGPGPGRGMRMRERVWERTYSMGGELAPGVEMEEEPQD